MKIHVVQLGDTLWKLAEKYNASFEELKKINSHLANPEKLMPGMKIKIPSSAKTVQKEKSKKEQMTPVSKEKSKKEQMTPVSKEKTKTSTKEKTNEVKKEEKKKTEHPFKQKSPTPIAVLKEDDQKEKKKEQFEATMPKMPKVPSMPILEKETKVKQQPMKPKEPPKPKKEKPSPAAEQQPASKEEAKHQQALFNFESLQQQEPMPCDPVAFIPPMPIMPMFYMPCPPMPYYDPCMVQPGMQQGFPMMPPMGDCGCGGQNHFPPMQAPFNGTSGEMGFQEEQQPAMNQHFNGMIPNQQRTANQVEEQQPTTARNNYVPPANNEPATHQEADKGMFPPFNANHLSTSAPFMGNARNHQSATGDPRYMQPDQASIPNPSTNALYPKPPFYPKLPEDKYDSNS